MGINFETSAKTSSRIEVVSKLVSAVLDESVKEVSLVEEQGNVNVAYSVATRNRNLIVRMRFDRGELNQFEREKRCADLIRKDFDWTPEIIAIGKFEGHSYSVQHKVPGVVASKYSGDLADIWEQIGRYASIFHEIRTPGYLREAFSATAATKAAWCQPYFDELGEAGKAQLVSRGLLTREEFAAALEVLQPLRQLVFLPTLAHGNLSLNNIIVDANSKAHIIDWGSCVGHMSSALDLSELLAFEVPQPHLQAYLRGHGLPKNYVEQNWKLLEQLRLVRCFSNAHWLCESRSKRESDLLTYVEKTRDSIRRLV